MPHLFLSVVHGRSVFQTVLRHTADTTPLEKENDALRTGRNLSVGAIKTKADVRRKIKLGDFVGRFLSSDKIYRVT